MMSRPDRDAVPIEHRCEVVRMKAFDLEGENREAALAGADQPHAIHLGETVDAIAGERLLVLQNRVAA
jgi:hypothetical protein